MKLSSRCDYRVPGGIGSPVGLRYRGYGQFHFVVSVYVIVCIFNSGLKAWVEQIFCIYWSKFLAIFNMFLLNEKAMSRKDKRQSTVRGEVLIKRVFKWPA